jgi:hypothetical protein
MSGDRNNTTRATRGRAARLAVALSLGAIGLALASIPAAIADPVDNHPQPDEDKAAAAAQTLLADRTADGPRAGARARDGRPATAPTIDPAAIPWDEIAAFMRQHSPLKWERWEQFDRMYPGPARGGWDRGEMKQRLQDGIRAQYAQLKRIESIDSDEYKLEVRRVELEDKIFGAAVDFKRGAGDDAKQSLARGQMKQHVRDFLSLRDELQKHRLERRKAELGRQSEQIEKQLAFLEQKPKPKEQRITNLANQFLTAQPPALFGGPGGGPGGPGGPRSGQPRRDGGPEGREQQSGRAGPTTNRSAEGESPKGEKSPAPADQK